MGFGRMSCLSQTGWQTRQSWSAVIGTRIDLRNIRFADSMSSALKAQHNPRHPSAGWNFAILQFGRNHFRSRPDASSYAINESVVSSCNGAF